ncbi:uncharacterized protein LOC130667961 [Microplitis mediator]|uniref:uncharacterized protein LOC130667961 n=1 Tax=Microplitis mediator TaxID=375433 RepID=UPI002553D2D6|nr:uncharacterized protein LOC130667961 [Microplitis mediator]
MSQSSTRNNVIIIKDFVLHLSNEDEWIDSKKVDLIDDASCGQVYISGIRHYCNKLNVTIRKTFIKSAIATIELKMSDQDSVIQNFDEWEESCGFKNMTLPHDFWNCYGCKPGGFRTINHIHKYEYNVNISCKIIWYGFFDDFTSNAYKNLKNYLNNSTLSDVMIKVKDKEYPAHKIILVSQSSVFEKMLTTDMKESRENCINLPELDVEVAEELLYFLYHGELDKACENNEMLLKLLEVGHLYQLSNLNNICGLLLSKSMTVDNVLMLYENAKKYDSFILYHLSKAFIRINRKEIILSDNFKEFCLIKPEFMFKFFTIFNDII